MQKNKQKKETKTIDIYCEFMVKKKISKEVHI